MDLMIEVTLLGTGSPIPDPNRAGPSTLVRAGGQVFLVDCGRGVLQRAAAVGVGAAGLSALLLTHLHSDHIAELGDVLITSWVTTFAADPAPLPIIGPPGTAETVAGHAAGVRPRHRLPDRPSCRPERAAADRGPRIHRGPGVGPRRRDDPGGSHRPPAGGTHHRVPDRSRRRFGGAGRRHRAMRQPGRAGRLAQTRWYTP